MNETRETDQVEALLQAARELIEKEPHFQEREARLTEILGLLLHAEDLYREMREQCQVGPETGGENSLQPASTSLLS